LRKGVKCSVCGHRELQAINLALARGVSVTALVRRYKLGPDSIYRHRANHLPATVRAKLLAGRDIEIDLDQLRESESQSLLANLVALRHRLFAWTLPKNTTTPGCSPASAPSCTPTWN
jgi:hypothetical protein